MIFQSSPHAPREDSGDSRAFDLRFEFFVPAVVRLPRRLHHAERDGYLGAAT